MADQNHKQSNAKTALAELAAMVGIGAEPPKEASKAAEAPQAQSSSVASTSVSGSDYVPPVTPPTDATSSAVPVYSAPSKSYIASDLKIRGDVFAEGNLEVLGSIEGNVDIKGELLVKGSLKGDVEAAKLILDGGNIIADQIVVEGDVNALHGAVVQGNIQAENIALSGKVTGNIEAKNLCVIESAAQVVGDIKAKSLSVSQGAMLSGRVDIEGMQVEYS